MMTGAIDNSGVVSLDGVLLSSSSTGAFSGEVFEVYFDVNGNAGKSVFITSGEILDGRFKFYNSVLENSK
jgi:hypothetical protein